MEKTETETALGFDAALMNPPFSREQDILHDAASWRVPRPRGRARRRLDGASGRHLRRFLEATC